MITFSLFAVLLGGMLVGLPIVLSIGLATLVHTVDVGPNVLNIFMLRLFSGATSYSFAAVPMFMIAGDLMGGTGITKRLLALCNSLVGHMKGALAQVNIVASIFFAGISGSALADTAALGSVLIPAMEEDGYERGFAGAVTAASATIGPIIPPSIVMVIYASTFGLSVGALFAAGLVPGLVLGITLMLITYIISVKRGYPTYTRASLREIGKSFVGAWSALIMPFIILGGIFLGIVTATEAAAVSALYALIIGIMFYRDLSVKKIYGMFRANALRMAGIMLILAVSQNFAWVISRRRIPHTIVANLLEVTASPVLLMLIIFGALFIAGMFVERNVALFIFGPILLPVLTGQLGLTPLHAGMVMIFTLGIGHITPPFGGTLYTAAMVGEIKVEHIVRYLTPYLLGMIIVALLIMFWAPLVTFFPSLVGY